MTQAILDEIRGLYEDSDKAYEEACKLRAGAKYLTGADRETALAEAVKFEESAVQWTSDALELEVTLI